MRAAAQFNRKIAHPHHAHDVAVLVAEERERAGLDRVVVGHLFGRDLGVFADTRVDLLFDRRQVALADRARVREIEAQAIGRDHRARLMDTGAEHVAQRVMQDMGRGMIEHRGVVARAIDDELDAASALEVARLAAHEAPDMENRAVGLARVDDLEDRAGAGFDHAAVADLAAALGVKGRFGGHHEDPIFAVAMGREHFGLGVVAMVSDEARARAGVEFYFRGDRVVLARGASALALLFHETLEARDIDLQFRALAGHPWSDRAESRRCRRA